MQVLVIYIMFCCARVYIYVRVEVCWLVSYAFTLLIGILNIISLGYNLSTNFTIYNTIYNTMVTN